MQRFESSSPKRHYASGAAPAAAAAAAAAAVYLLNSGRTQTPGCFDESWIGSYYLLQPRSFRSCLCVDKGNSCLEKACNLNFCCPLSSLNSYGFDFIYDFISSIVAFTRISFRIFVRERRTHGFQHGIGNIIFRCDKFQAVLLPADFFTYEVMNDVIGLAEMFHIG